MFPDSVLLSLTDWEDGDTGRRAIKSLKLTQESPILFFFPPQKKVGIAFAYR